MTQHIYIEFVRGAKKTYEYVVGRNAHAVILLVLKNLRNADVSVRVRLTKPGAEAKIVGIVVGGAKDTVRLHTMQIHEAPETTSDLLVKGVLDGEASLLYDGGIRVAEKAQKTNAYQRNENLLLSSSAHAQSKPALEILANDVRCTHGATVGTLSREQLWYLESRGIEKKQGTTLIVQGFLRSALRDIPDTIISREVRRRLWKDT